MERQYITLLQKQIKKLDDPDFDLEAWKSVVGAYLTKVFGASDPMVKQILDLKIDYSSWVLRDSNSQYKPVETCKKKGKAIIEASIEEINLLSKDPKQILSVMGLNALSDPSVSKKEKMKLLSKIKKAELSELVLKLLS